jgi:superfamily II helicase
MKGSENENIGISGVIEILKSKNRDIEFVRIPLFEISAKDFLIFAKSDFKDNDEKGLINALSNAKRAISNRMDEMIKLSCLQKISSKKRWNIPTKMDKLSAIGIFVPRLLQRKITSMRNLLEHEYIRPKDSQEVEDVIEIAELFLASTDKYIEFGLLGAIDLLGYNNAIFNIMSEQIEIYTEKHEEIIDLSQVEENDLMNLAKALTNCKTNETSYSHYGDMSWDDFYADKVNKNRNYAPYSKVDK